MIQSGSLGIFCKDRFGNSLLHYLVSLRVCDEGEREGGEEEEKDESPSRKENICSDVRDANISTPLPFLISPSSPLSRSDFLSLLDLSLAHNADISQPNHFGQTPLHFAIRNVNSAACFWLLTHLDPPSLSLSLCIVGWGEREREKLKRILGKFMDRLGAPSLISHSPSSSSLPLPSPSSSSSQSASASSPFPLEFLTYSPTSLLNRFVVILPAKMDQATPLQLAELSENSKFGLISSIFVQSYLMYSLVKYVHSFLDKGISWANLPTSLSLSHSISFYLSLTSLSISPLFPPPLRSSNFSISLLHPVQTSILDRHLSASPPPSPLLLSHLKSKYAQIPCVYNVFVLCLYVCVKFECVQYARLYCVRGKGEERI